MLRYRAATYLVRTTAPELTMGFTVDEVHDENTVQGSVIPKTTNLGDVMKAIAFDEGEPVAETLAESMESMDAEAKGGDLFKSEGNYE